MICKLCGAENPKDAKICGMCGKLTRVQPIHPYLNVAIIIAICLTIIAFLAALFVPRFIQPRNKSRYQRCLQSMQTLSKGMQEFLSEKGVFNGITQSGGNGDEICERVIPGYKNSSVCAGKVSEKMKQICLDYRIDINKPSLQKYEISGHSDERMKCGICVTETGYCPTRYSGEEPAWTHCEKSCVAAGENSTAVCPH